MKQTKEDIRLARLASAALYANHMHRMEYLSTVTDEDFDFNKNPCATRMMKPLSDDDVIELNVLDIQFKEWIENRRKKKNET